MEAIEDALEKDGNERAGFLLETLISFVQSRGARLDFKTKTPFVNTILPGDEPDFPGDRAMERKIKSTVRWNAMAMVTKANKVTPGIGGHISTYASAATLYEIGFNHYFKGSKHPKGKDLIFFQGHASPGIYARAYIEWIFNKENLHGFRRDLSKDGVSSYPHPWLMPEFWQFPTVSMGLGPMMAIYQARFMRYMEHRELISSSDRKVWCFIGDGEMDEPESLGAITMPVREGLDNLVFVVNCNLQRLDGPVRGNGKIIQELEAAFGGAGWNVIKVIWGSRWDPLLAKDNDGLLQRVMEECVDGEYQNFKSKGGDYVRKHFFGRYPETHEMVANMSDENIWRLNRGGHDAIKVYSAYKNALNHKGGPTVILAKTVKGFGMGSAGEGQNIAHQQKKLDIEALKEFRDRFNIPVSNKDIDSIPYCKPDSNSIEMQYLHEKRQSLGGYLPKRRVKAPKLMIPALKIFKTQLDGSGDREISTTMAFIRMLTALVRDKKIGKNIVPIVPDEARTFGMEGMFRQIGIYSSKGQLYTPQDAGQLMYYREDKKGQILEEGINEAGAFCSWLASGTSYSNHNTQTIPFYIYYSMFGFQRIGDFIWAGGDLQSRGFLMGGTAGRTTLAGEGLQHQDGHSLIHASTIPNCISYDPTYAYELAIIIHDGLKRMIGNQENIFYYITCMNENYIHPCIPKGVSNGILKGMYRLKRGGKKKLKAQLMGSGTILREVLASSEILLKDFGIDSDVWSVTSFNELRRNALQIERWNNLNPDKQPKKNYIQSCLSSSAGPFIAATDYMKIIPDQIQRWVPGTFVSLGTDGYGRSDARSALRKHFEVDRWFIVITTLKALSDQGMIDGRIVSKAIKKYGIDPSKKDPVNL